MEAIAMTSPSTVPCSTPPRGNFATVSTADKVSFRKTFLEKIQKANKKPLLRAVTHNDIRDVLVKNGMSQVQLEGQKGELLYKYSGKWESLRAPTDFSYAAMKHAMKLLQFNEKQQQRVCYKFFLTI